MCIIYFNMELYIYIYIYIYIFKVNGTVYLVPFIDIQLWGYPHDLLP